MRVLVCGGRDYQDYNYVKTVLSALQVTRGQFTVMIHGDATGADALADRYARRHLIPVLAFAADWDTHGRSAGPIRNQYMLEAAKPDLVVVFPGGKGTAGMMTLAKAAGVEILDARPNAKAA